MIYGLSASMVKGGNTVGVEDVRR